MVSNAIPLRDYARNQLINADQAEVHQVDT